MIKIASSESGNQETVEQQSNAQSSSTGFASIGIDGTFLVAQVVNFFILFFVLRALLYKPVLNLLNERAQKIEKSLKLAQENEAKSAALVEQERQILSQARQQASSILADAEQASKEAAHQIKVQAQNDAEAILARTKESLAQEKLKIINSAQSELANLVIKATEKILKSNQINVSDQEVKSVLKRLEKSHETHS